MPSILKKINADFAKVITQKNGQLNLCEEKLWLWKIIFFFINIFIQILFSGEICQDQQPVQQALEQVFTGVCLCFPFQNDLNGFSQTVGKLKIIR